jgi:ankyrin repeat protein
MSELMKAIYTGANTSAYTNYILDMIPNSDLSYTDSDKNTAFMFACKYQLPEVALALLNTGQFKPDHINKFGMTALIYSCTRRMYDVAIALINTGQSNLNAVSRYKETA